MVFGRVLYRSVNLSAFVIMVQSIFTKFDVSVLFDGTLVELGLDAKDLFVLVAAIIILLSAELLQRTGSLREKLANQNLVFRWGVLITGILCVLIFGWYGGELQAVDFLYFRY